MLRVDEIQLTVSISQINISGEVSPSESFYKMKIFFMFIADTPELILKIA